MSILEGPLCKWTNVVNGWQYRWFVLDHDQALLSYYTSKEKMVRGDRRGCVRLKGAVIGIDAEEDCTFTITVDCKMFHFQAQTAEERVKWVTALEETILRHTHRRRPKRSEHFQVPSIRDYERKIAETDTYLNLLINQSKHLDNQIDSATDEGDKQKLVDIKASLLSLLDSVKHTIILLQIAKNTLNPINGVLNERMNTNSEGTQQSTKDANKAETRSSLSDSDCQNDPNDPSGNRSSLKLTNTSTTTTATEGEEEEEEEEEGTVTQIRDHHFNRDVGSHSRPESASSTNSVDNNKLKRRVLGDIGLNGVPEMSYSSSDEEDCFYDATEETPSLTSPIGSIDAACKTIESFNINSLSDFNMDSSTIDYDKFYEEDDDDDLSSFESHGSVISHLLSQVKIGMDLTKVVLPTFILERRSLLEMYADFFAHPDLFTSIPDFETPEDRFIATVRWYLSAFHAGRKTSVAKKPYNPVLGEIFKCYWKLPGVSNQSESETGEKLVSDGPIPWATSNDLTFLAEQVSHHPPISAFYAEHVDKRIMCSAHIYTKSKFLGLSIGVLHIGQGSIYLLDKGEEYIITFPSAYGRSILTVPWIELGGSVSVTCPQSGYHANIDFLTKPFYGGKKHRVTGEILNPSKKVIMTLSGEWNGVMYSKRPNSQAEVFVDTKAMKTIKKVVKPISEQEVYESRRLWKEVTRALKMRDVNAATNAKFAVEQGQRDLVKERQQTKEKWINRVFHNLGDNWYFNQPLTKRSSKGTKQ
ncbi:oxysterol-binding protein-related protein 9 isoform X1 [Tetranychus urticae]|uniref:oxysterol-binding protein-related protein 9 isoform X1 n=1 Tax=Tetranychus urticae TaxID=32264 RepID=UPI00077BA136|nr:oxysterol-binding protein-related protein 9 isoform X1 [Tetranychus urticae]